MMSETGDDDRLVRSDTDHGHERPGRTAATMASDPVAVATALAKQPIPA